jgi:hypothetical protein
VNARARKTVFALLAASLLFAGGSAGADASATVVRVYDIEITATENAHGISTFEADVTWVERYANVRVTFVPTPAYPSPSAARAPARGRGRGRPTGSR